MPTKSKAPLHCKAVCTARKVPPQIRVTPTSDRSGSRERGGWAADRAMVDMEKARG
ncbi:hypothetical protein D3C85_1908920 [compost metagenome]